MATAGETAPRAPRAIRHTHAGNAVPALRRLVHLTWAAGACLKAWQGKESAGTFQKNVLQLQVAVPNALVVHVGWRGRAHLFAHLQYPTATATATTKQYAAGL